MAPTKALPFLVSPKLDIRAIGTPDIGIIHLVKKGGISPNENPVDLQAEGNRQAKTQLMIKQAVLRLAKEQGISQKEARKKLFAQPIKDAAGNAIEEDEREDMFDHLTPEESSELLSLRENVAATAIRAATLFIRYRVAYPVQLVANAKAKTDRLHLQPTGFPIADGQKVKFGYCKVEVDGFQDDGSEEVAVKPLSQPLEAESIGYLLDFETGKVKVGDSDWTEDHTRELLTEELILHIYSFYQLEMSGVPETEVEPTAEEDEDLGKNPALSSSDDLPIAA